MRVFSILLDLPNEQWVTEISADFCFGSGGEKMAKRDRRSSEVPGLSCLIHHSIVFSPAVAAENMNTRKFRWVTFPTVFLCKNPQQAHRTGPKKMY